MPSKYRGLAAMQSHIQAFWLERHGVEKPLSPDPKNVFLERFLARVNAIIEHVDQTRRELQQPKKSSDSTALNASEIICELNEHIYEALRPLLSELVDMEKTHFADRQFCNLIEILRQNIEGESIHLESQFVYQTDPHTYAKFLGGVLIDNIAQSMIPFYGAQADPQNPSSVALNVGICFGLVDARANGREFKTFEVFDRQIKQDITYEHFHATANIFSIDLILDQVGNLKRDGYYTSIIFHSNKSGHIIEIRECNPINEFEIFDPNYGVYRFPDIQSANQFVKYLAFRYWTILGLDSCEMTKKPLEDPSHSREADISYCKKATENLTENEIYGSFSHIHSKLSKYKYEPSNITSKLFQYLKLITSMIAQCKNTEFSSFAFLLDKIFDSNHPRVAMILCKSICNRRELSRTQNPDTQRIEQYSTIIKMINNLYSTVGVSYEYEEQMMIKLYQTIYDKHYKTLFEKLSSENLFKLTELHLNVNFDLDKLEHLVKLHGNIIIEFIPFTSLGVAERKELFELLYKTSDIKFLYHINESLWNGENNSLIALKLYNAITLCGKSADVLAHRSYYNGDFFKLMAAIHIKNPEMPPHELFDRTILAHEEQRVTNMIKAGNLFDPENFRQLIEKIVTNKYVDENTKKKYVFIREMFETLNTKDPQKVNSFFQKNIADVLSHIELCEKLSYRFKQNEIMMKLMCNHLCCNLDERLSWHYLFELYNQPRYRMMVIVSSAETLLYSIRLENNRFLLPILTDPDTVKRMNPEQFKQLITVIVSLDKNLTLLNETLLNKNFLSKLPKEKILALFKCLVTAGENEHSLAEKFQYPAKQQGNNTQTQWTIIIENLRGAYGPSILDRFISDPAVAKDVALLRSNTMTVLNETQPRSRPEMG